MGKSPTKWMKKFLNRKKSSKSYPSQNAVEAKSSAPFHSSSDETSSNPAISDLASSNAITGRNPEVEQEKNVNLCCGDSASGAISYCSVDFSHKAELHKLEVSATIMQSALRAFMARQAYQSLKGIVRLQALIRGHLVRRQAAATLHCVKGIVKLQAVVRGRVVRLSDVGVEVNKLLGKTVQDAYVTNSHTPNASTVLEKLPPNVFACKVLASSISTSPLHFQYDPTEPNSLSVWVERWSSSHFWGSVAQQKKVSGSAVGRKRSITQTADVEHISTRRDVRRASTGNEEYSSQHMSSEHGKVKRYSRKPILSQHGEAGTQKLSENELERVKRNLRKISLNSSKESSQGKTGRPSIETVKQRNVSSVQPQGVDDDNNNNNGNDKDKAEGESGVLQPSNGSVSNSSSASDVKEHGLIKSASGPDDELKPSGEKIQRPDKGAVSETLIIVHESDLSDNSLSTEQYSEGNGLAKGESVIASVNENSGKEKRKSTPRRKSLPSNKQENLENVSTFQSKPNLPSYMAATESAKRKLRGLGGTPRFSMEGEEESCTPTSTRQYSLSTSANGKLSSSVSPRILKFCHSSEKDGGLMRGGDRSLSSSRDSYGKVTRPGWRR